MMLKATKLIGQFGLRDWEKLDGSDDTSSNCGTGYDVEQRRKTVNDTYKHMIHWPHVISNEEIVELTQCEWMKRLILVWISNIGTRPTDRIAQISLERMAEILMMVCLSIFACMFSIPHWLCIRSSITSQWRRLCISSNGNYYKYGSIYSCGLKCSIKFTRNIFHIFKYLMVWSKYSEWQPKPMCRIQRKCLKWKFALNLNKVRKLKCQLICLF